MKKDTWKGSDDETIGSVQYEDFLKNARTEIMGDPEAVRLMRATHVKKPA